MLPNVSLTLPGGVQPVPAQTSRMVLRALEKEFGEQEVVEVLKFVGLEYATNRLIRFTREPVRSFHGSLERLGATRLVYRYTLIVEGFAQPIAIYAKQYNPAALWGDIDPATYRTLIRRAAYGRFIEEARRANVAAQEGVGRPAMVLHVKNMPMLIQMGASGRSLDQVEHVTPQLIRAIGVAVGRLHHRDIVHGDLVHDARANGSKDREVILRSDHIWIDGGDGAPTATLIDFGFLENTLGYDGITSGMTIEIERQLLAQAFCETYAHIAEVREMFNAGYEEGFGGSGPGRDGAEPMNPPAVGPMPGLGITGVNAIPTRSLRAPATDA